MKITKLETKEQLQNLKRNDRLIVEWGPGSTAFHLEEPITMTRAWGINHLNEVIVRLKGNLYFSIDMFIEGKSSAKEVYLIEESGVD